MPLKKTSEEGYEVNIELKDQLNNVFYIDNVNNDKSIMLKDGKFTKKGKEEKEAIGKATHQAKKEFASQEKDGTQVKTIDQIREKLLEQNLKDDSTKKIIIFRDIYYLDNTVIQDLRTIFKKHVDRYDEASESDESYESDEAEDDAITDKDKEKEEKRKEKEEKRKEKEKLKAEKRLEKEERRKEEEKKKEKAHRFSYGDYDNNDTRQPININTVTNLMKNTNELSEIHSIFTSNDFSKSIKDNIIHFNSGTNSRVKQLNSRDAINRYIVDYYKYINNSKKTSDFDDDEKMDTLMFYNVMYLLKNIYLKKQTILINIQDEKYYVDEILFYDLPYVHMIKKDYDKPKKINIYLRIKTIPIIIIPIIKIHYIVDDLEVQSLKLSAPRELKPVDLDKDFAKYNTMYIFNKFKYKDETDSMAAFFNSLKREKRVDKIQELFFNADIVNKYQKRFNERQRSKNTNIQEKKIAQFETTEQREKRTAAEAKEKHEKDKAARKEEEKLQNNNINANIVYLLRQNFNLIDNKISIDNTTIDDTYIAYNISNNISSNGVKYHSIMTNKKYDNYDNPRKETIIQNIIVEHRNRFSANYIGDNFFYIDERTDIRLPATVYNIIVIFRTYKVGSNKKKPSLTRRYIGDECLSNAVTLDSIFSKIFYRSLGLPDKYLYDKLANITSKITSSSDSNSAGKSAMSVAANISGIPNLPVPVPPPAPAPASAPIPKKGGKKYNTKKNRVKKQNTRKYRKKSFRTKKIRAKLF
jgi:hypothetical protein